MDQATKTPHLPTTPYLDLNSTASHQVPIDVSVSESVSMFLFYYQCAVVVIGCIGTAANGTVLAAIIVGMDVKKKTANLLLLNQVALDFYSCLLQVIASAVKANRSIAHWAITDTVCILLTSDMLTFVGMDASITNLAV